MKDHEEGFTLAELLVVVAIIGVLVAISIPIFTTQLEKARIAVDQANVRSAKAAAAAEYMTSNSFHSLQTYYYSGSGVLVPADQKDSIQGYGKSSNPDPDATITGGHTSSGKAPKGGYVYVTIDTDGVITAYWEGGSNSNVQKTVNTSSPAYGSNFTKGYSWSADSHSIVGDKNKYNTFNWKSGLTIKEDDVLYVFSIPMQNKNSTSDIQGAKVTNYSSMAEFYNAYQEYFTKIDETTETVNLSEDEYTSYQGTFDKGTVVKVGSKYYVAVADGVTSSSALNDTTQWAYVHD